MFYASQKSKPKDLSKAVRNEAFDLMEESKSAHHALDEILMKHKDTWQLQDTDRKEKTEKMPSTGVEVHYTQREVDIGVPPTTELEGAAAWLKQHLDLPEGETIEKTDPRVLFLKDWVDRQYAEGRVTAITDDELYSCLSSMEDKK